MRAGPAFHPSPKAASPLSTLPQGEGYKAAAFMELWRRPRQAAIEPSRMWAKDASKGGMKERGAKPS